MARKPGGMIRFTSLYVVLLLLLCGYPLEVFSKGGGYVFNTVHNTQANTPIPNFIAMLTQYSL